LGCFPLLAFLKVVPFGITLRARAMIHWLGEPFQGKAPVTDENRLRALSLRYTDLQFGKT
jgi:hypothetical protein